MWSHKRLSAILIIIIGLVVIVFLFFLYSYYTSLNEVDEISKEIDEISKEIDDEAVDQNLAILKDPSISTADKYKALLTVTFYFNAKYYRTHDPSIREYVMTNLNEFAKENFPKEYNTNDFNTPCSDPKCGQELDIELITALKLMEEANIPQPIKDTINITIKTAGYAPEKDRNDRIFGIELAIDQLKYEGDKIASDAASLLLEYLAKNYEYESE